MSTKCSLAHGSNFHLYLEPFDDDHLYLEIENAHFEASHNRVLIPIPIYIWEFIRRQPGTKFEYADKTDVELRQYVEASVDERLELYAAASDGNKSLASLRGALVYGTIDQPREEQIAMGVAHFFRLRSHHQQILRAITELEELNK